MTDYERDSMPLNFSTFLDNKMLSGWDVENTLKKFLILGAISKIHITKEEPTEDGEMNAISNFYFTSDEVAKKDKEEFFFRLMPDYKGEEDFLWNFHVAVNEKKCREYIRNYIAYWKENKFKHERRNILQSRKQVGKIVYKIMLLLTDYPSVNLLVKYVPSAYEEMDFLATLLFLESINDIEVTEFTFIDENIAFRINIKDKFHKDFPPDHSISFSEYKIIDSIDLDKITTIALPEKVIKKIALKAPKLLAYSDLEYEIKENKVPYHLIRLATKNKGTVDQIELRNVSGETQDKIKKALDNFRKGLRKNFDFPASELFFDLKGGLIQFKSELFDFP